MTAGLDKVRTEVDDNIKDLMEGQGTLEDAMVEEVAKREKQREAQERKDQLERLVERNTRLRAMVIAAVDDRDVERLKRVLHQAQFSRAEFAEACRLLRRISSAVSYTHLTLPTKA